MHLNGKSKLNDNQTDNKLQINCTRVPIPDVSYVRDRHIRVQSVYNVIIYGRVHMREPINRLQGPWQYRQHAWQQLNHLKQPRPLPLRPQLWPQRLRNAPGSRGKIGDKSAHPYCDATLID